MGKGKYVVFGVLTLAPMALAWYFMRPSELPSPQESLAERTFMAFPVSVSADSLVLDEAEWLTDEAATAAMREDGVCPDGEPCEPPNGFYIRNASPEVARYSISPAIELTMQTWSHDEQGGYNWNQTVPYVEFLERASEYRTLPFYAVVRGQEVVRLTEQYVP